MEFEHSIRELTVLLVQSFAAVGIIWVWVMAVIKLHDEAFQLRTRRHSRFPFTETFKDKEDILARYIESITDEFISSASIPVLRGPWSKYIAAILNHMYKNRDLVTILLKNNKLHLINVDDALFYVRASF